MKEGRKDDEGRKEGRTMKEGRKEGRKMKEGKRKVKEGLGRRVTTEGRKEGRAMKEGRNEGRTEGRAMKEGRKEGSKEGLNPPPCVELASDKSGRNQSDLDHRKFQLHPFVKDAETETGNAQKIHRTHAHHSKRKVPEID